MFVLAELIGRPDTGKGVAIAFGPGLAAEGFHFERAEREKPVPAKAGKQAG
jgi:predicted naringenin-chalcone synthase